MSTRPRHSVIDVAHLPNVTVGAEAVIWWGNMLMFLIEGSMFVMVGVTYFYLREQVTVWPPPGADRPGLLWPTVTTALLLLAGAPMWVVDRACRRFDRGPLRPALAGAILLVAGALVSRVQEFRGLDFKWSEHAYGSIVWTILGLHTSHMIALTLEACVLAALLFFGPFREKHFIDLRTTAMYWLFVFGSWLPFYAILVAAPR
jgi:cytochrome c oxidase subunit I+III